MSDVLTHNDSPPVPPVPPGDDECCRSGCDPCIFDLHALAMERYRAELQAWEERQKSTGLESVNR
ncbi:MAG TPA: oxidoreductase-like domain-containing protein [Noviherbaspirillum sp.]|nr:oxidoreductase-like domain-containing protein [Noviherbaspirillum sp.]